MTGNDVTYRVRYGQFTIVYYAYDSVVGMERALKTL